MGRKRKAVSRGNKLQQLTRHCNASSDSANVAESSGTGKSGTTMSSTRSKRNPRKGPKGKWDPEKLMTTSKSALIDLDLVKLLARPEAWDVLDETEKEEILTLLPDHVHPHPYPAEDGKIPPLPESFLRYSAHWRDGVRQFQEDLENSRFDPEWIRQADEAVQERAAGEFDNFKEKEFEEFWGQKQKFDKTLAAGESSQVKLKTLVEHGFVREGDVWKLSRGFNLSRSKILIEKEAKILELNGSHMTCIVPAGQRQILPPAPEAEFQVLLAAYKSMAKKTTEKATENTDHAAEEKEEQPVAVNEEPESGPPKRRKLERGGRLRGNQRQEGVETNDISEKKEEQIAHADEEPAPNLPGKRNGRSRKNQQQEVPKQEKADDKCDIITAGEYAKGETKQTISVEVNNIEPTEESDSPSIVINTAAASAEPDSSDKPALEPETTQTVSIAEPQDTSRSPSPMLLLGGVEVVILPNIPGISALEHKMVEVDGRIKHIPNGNAWKEFRSYRNNQDMGSLWEVRQAWYMRGK